MLQGFGIGAGRERKEAGQSPTVLPFGSPPRLRSPQGSLHRKGEALRPLLKRRYGVTSRAEGFTQPSRGTVRMRASTNMLKNPPARGTREEMRPLECPRRYL
jgi:hypothetical protein